VNVFDASALLAFLQGEDGDVEVEERLSEGGLCGAANWSEAAQKMRSHGREWDLAGALLTSYGVAVEPVIQADAEWAATRWRRGEGLSLADRLCLALGERVDGTVWTADLSWGHDGRIRQIR